MKKMFKVKCFMVSLLLFAICFDAMGQSTELGQVKEYLGEQPKKPLANVELNIAGAASTISDSRGNFTLQFNVLKPGDAVRYNEIFKTGYVLFNTEQLRAWRISRDQTPFTIVMCKEDMFRALTKKYYGILEKSYREEYVAQCEYAKKLEAANEEIEQRLEQAKQEYQSKLSNINTYADAFARIDRSEMDSIESKALQLLDEGRVREAIAKYEELDLKRKAKEQLEKFSAGQVMIRTAHSDLLTVAEKLKTQIGLYTMGGSEYDTLLFEDVDQLIEIYKKLKEEYGEIYNNELGKWLVNKSIIYHNYVIYGRRNSPFQEKILVEAANLPSYYGLWALGNLYERKSAFGDSDSMMAMARKCYEQAIPLYEPQGDTSENLPLNRMETFPDFTIMIGNAPISFSIYNNSDSVLICKPNMYYSNDPIGTLMIPSTVKYSGKKYHVVGIYDEAFMYAPRLKNIVIPSSIIWIGGHAFSGCNSLEICRIEGDPQIIDGAKSDITFPLTVAIYTIRNPIRMYKWLWNRHDGLVEEAKKSTEHKKIFSQLLHNDIIILKTQLNNKYTLEENRPYIFDWLGNIYSDTSMLGFDMKEAREWFKKLKDADSSYTSYVEWQIANTYYLEHDYKNALKHYALSAKRGYANAYNSLAYMYARGETEKQDFNKAFEYINMAIAYSPNEANYYDSKGEIYLMYGDTNNARKCLQQAMVLLTNGVSDDSVEIVQEQYYNASNLYQSLYPKQETVLDSISQTLLNHFLALAALSARIIFDDLGEYKDNIEIEELIAIGVIAIQVLIKNKTQDQLSKYTDLYVVTAVSWVINNELELRYEWYLANKKYMEYPFVPVIRDELNQKSMVRLSMYHYAVIIFEKTQETKSFFYDEEKSDFEDIVLMGSLINDAINNLPERSDVFTGRHPIRELVRDVIMNKKMTSEELQKKYNMSLEQINETVDAALVGIKEYLNAHDKYGY